jgi:hypothetical protein
MEKKYNDLTEEEQKRANDALGKLQRMKSPDITKDDIALVRLLIEHLETLPKEEPKKLEDEESPAGVVNLSTIMSKEHLSQLQNFLNNNGESPLVGLNKIYTATIDGDLNFHGKCDSKGPTVIVIKANGHIFGGYVSIDWDCSGSFKTDTKSFIFSLTNPKKYNVVPATNYWAIYAVSGTLSFYFGYPGDIVIKQPFLNDSSNSCKVGACYRSGNVEDNDFLAGSETFKVDEMEVFQVTRS